MLVPLLVLLSLSLGVLCELLPLVQTPLGTVRGYHKTSFDGRTFSAFEGIPYAKPPIGDLRFEEPQPVEPWLGVWNASFLTVCAQFGITMVNASGTENCLHVNVYVPRKQPDPSESLDVIVHIHGGAYMVGDGNRYSRPDVLMDKEVVYVSFNYRLGIFGFLSTEDEVVPGNNGLKDQTMALKWVQENIASFGGNPKSVTITGLSAGGSGVHMHYFSPLSKGLFHRGFAQSGTALSSWSIQENPLQRTKKLAEALGCPISSTRTMITCLKQRPAQQISPKVKLFYTIRFMPCIPFGPVVEKGGSNPFINEDPYILLKKGQINDVPLLASTTTHEGSFPALLLIKEIDYIGQNWETLGASILEFRDTLPQSSWPATLQKIKEFYFKDAEINRTNMMTLMQLFTDRYITIGAETSVRMQAKVAKSPVYYYVFGYPGENNPQPIVGHGSDAKYFFGPGTNFVSLTPNEILMKDMLVDMLMSFVKTGEPSLGSVEWKPTKSDELTYLRVNGVNPGEISLETVAELTPRSFWDSLGLMEGENLINRKDEL